MATVIRGGDPSRRRDRRSL